jgi:hypothetical protein
LKEIPLLENSVPLALLSADLWKAYAVLKEGNLPSDGIMYELVSDCSAVLAVTASAEGAEPLAFGLAVVSGVLAVCATLQDPNSSTIARYLAEALVNKINQFMNGPINDFDLFYSWQGFCVFN